MNHQPPKARKQLIEEHIAKQNAAFAAQFPNLARKKTPVSTRADFTQIALGFDDAGRIITLDELARLEHMHVIGATGSGKSTFLQNCVLQDIRRGRGLVLLDPHGAHPDSVLNTTLRYLRAIGFPSSKVHIISPNVPEFIVGINPLAALPGTDPSVIADALIRAFERTWGDEDTQQKPTTRRVLRTIFTALAACKMTLADAKDVLDYEDRRGVRRYLISELRDEDLRRDIERIQQLADEPRGRKEFELEVIGPANRLEEFVSNPTMRLMFGMNAHHPKHPAKTVDFLSIMEKGDVLLVDLQHGPQVSEAVTDMLGKIVLRYIVLLSNYRKNLEPFFLFADECQRFITEDVKTLLDEARKYRIGVTLAHRYLAELGQPDEVVYNAVLNSTHVKAVFRMNSADEAQMHAHNVVPLDLEVPIKASVRPTVVGYRLEWLKTESDGISESGSKSIADSVTRAIGEANTEMHSWARGHAHGKATGKAAGTALGSGHGTHTGTNTSHGDNTSLGYMYDPNSIGLITMPMPESMSTVSGETYAVANLNAENFQTSRVDSQVANTSEFQIDSEIESGGHAYTLNTLESRGKTTTQAREQGTTKTRGRGQAVIPVYEDLPAAFDTSKENALYRAGEQIRSLPTGRAIIRSRNNVVVVNVPPPRKSKPNA